MNEVTEHLRSSSGIYTLLLELKEEIRIKVGVLGNINFMDGFYSYTGSARGPAGFGRVGRHLDVACKRNFTRRWHIDYLLPYAAPLGAVLNRTNLDLECKISELLGSSSSTVSRFGCSDCGCRGHLHMFRNIDKLTVKVKEAHYQAAGDTPEHISIIWFQNLYPQK